MVTRTSLASLDPPSSFPRGSPWLAAKKEKGVSWLPLHGFGAEISDQLCDTKLRIPNRMIAFAGITWYQGIQQFSSWSTGVRICVSGLRDFEMGQ